MTKEIAEATRALRIEWMITEAVVAAEREAGSSDCHSVQLGRMEKALECLERAVEQAGEAYEPDADEFASAREATDWVPPDGHPLYKPAIPQTAEDGLAA